VIFCNKPNHDKCKRCRIDGCNNRPDNKALKLIFTEYQRAILIHKNKFNSVHEGYAIIKEELDELWDEIKKKESDRDSTRMTKEATQIGAMALRFLIDLCGEYMKEEGDNGG